MNENLKLDNEIEIRCFVKQKHLNPDFALIPTIQLKHLMDKAIESWKENEKKFNDTLNLMTNTNLNLINTSQKLELFKTYHFLLGQAPVLQAKIYVLVREFHHRLMIPVIDIKKEGKRKKKVVFELNYLLNDFTKN